MGDRKDVLGHVRKRLIKVNKICELIKHRFHGLPDTNQLRHFFNLYRWTLTGNVPS